MKNMVKDEKGVTIVALVITVIVLLILTGISIGEVSKRKGSVNESKDQIAFSELTKIQQAVMETYIKYRQLGNESLFKGIKMTTYSEVTSEFNQLESGKSLKFTYDGTEETDASKYYYKLQKSDLIQMGLSNINNDDEYIVNYSTGEVLNITQKQAIDGSALYVYGVNE